MMRSMRRVAFLVAVAACLPGRAAAAGANPIRKVVSLLENLQKKIEAEGAKEEELYNKFMCYCKTSVAELDKELEAGRAAIEMLSSAAESGANALKDLKEQLKGHVESRDQAKDDIATATSLRDKEGAAFAQYKATTEANIDGIKKALSALALGQGMGSFIQSASGAALKDFIMEKARMPDASRTSVLSFLSGTQEEDDDDSDSGEIVGILKQMGDQMAAALKEASDTEAAAVKAFDKLVAAKKTEIETLTTQIEEEMLRVGEGGVAGASGGNAVDDAKAQVEDNAKLLAETQASCKAKTGEYEAAKEARAQEMVAVADTIEILNSDEALEMFKKTLPGSSASFLQIAETADSVKARAQEALSGVPRRQLRARPELSLIALALQGKSKGFEEVIGMVDKLIGNLQKEQVDDDTKKDYCNQKFDESDDKKKDLKLATKDSESAMEELKGEIAKKVEELTALQDGLANLQMEVEEATDQRSMENMDFKTLTANNGVAKELLLHAKKKLSSAASFAQVAAASAGGKKIIDMLDVLIRDLDRETQTAEVTEKAAQKRFEELVSASQIKMAEDKQSVTNCEDAKAQLTEALETEMDAMADTNKKLMQIEEVIMGLHKECDWLLKNYDMRKQARNAELDAMGKAKAVLSGADASFLQVSQLKIRRHH